MNFILSTWFRDFLTISHYVYDLILLRKGRKRGKSLTYDRGIHMVRACTAKTNPHRMRQVVRGPGPRGLGEESRKQRTFPVGLGLSHCSWKEVTFGVPFPHTEHGFVSRE